MNYPKFACPQAFLIAAGLLFAATASSSLAATVRGHKSSVDEEISTATTYTGADKWGSASEELGLLLGYSESDYDEDAGAFVKEYTSTSGTVTSHRVYSYAFDAIFKLSGSAQFTNLSDITFLGTKPNTIEYDNEDEQNPYTYRYYYRDYVVISGDATFTNAGTISMVAASTSEVDNAISSYAPQFIITDNGTLYNTEAGTISDVSEIRLFGAGSSLVNEGIIDGDGLAIYATGSAKITNAAHEEIIETGTDEDTGEPTYVVETSDPGMISGVASINLSGEASFDNSALLIGDPADITLSDNATFTNEETGFVYGIEDVEISGNSSFVNKGEIYTELPYAEIILSDNATFTNASLLCAGAQDDDDDDSLSPQDLCLVLAGDAKFVNESTGLIYGEYIEIDLVQNASFTNRGIIYADGDDIDVEFAPVADGSASFVNNEVMAADEFYVYWDIYAEQDDETISSNSTGTFTNNGTITATTMDVALDIDINILVANAKNFQNMNPTGVSYFVNNGTIVADTVSVDSYVETTLKQGSQITGNLELGKASGYYYRLSTTSDDNTNSSSETFSSEGTIVADSTVLNIVLNSIDSDTPLIAGNLTLYTDTELNVNVEDSSKTQVYAVQLYGGKLVLLEQTTTIQNSNDSDATTATTEGKLLATEGTFTRASDGKVFLWELNTETGVIVALAEGIDEYFQIDETEQVADIPSTKVAAFAPSLETFSGTISGAGEVHATADLSFAGNAENYSGTTFVDAGTFTIEADAKLGTGSYDVAEDAVLAIAADPETGSERTFSNATSGDGKLLVGSGAVVSFTKSVGTATLEIEKGALLWGGVSLTHANATLVLSGNLELGAGEFVSFTNGGTIVIDSTAALLLTSDSGSEFTIFSGATIYSDEEQGVSAEEFLSTSDYLSKEAQTASVIYDTSNGLSITIINSNQDLLSRIRLHDGLGEKFIAAITGDEDWGLKNGFINANELDSFVSAVLNSPGSVGTALTTLSPLSYAAMVAMPSTAFHNDIRRIESRLATKRLKDSYSQQWGYIGKVDWGFFAQGQTTYLDNNGGKDSPVFDFETYGALVGAEAQVGDTFAAGLTVAYDNGKAKIHNGGGRIESDNARVTAFASCLIGELVFVNAGAQVGYGSYDIRRKTVLGRATGDTEGWNAGAFLDIGMHIKPFDEVGISFRPYVGIAYLHSRVNDFSDSKFDIDSFDGNSMRTRVGLGIFWDFYAAGSTWTLGIDGSYSHDFFGKEVDIDATYLATGGSFRATAKAMSTDVFSVGPVVNIALNENIALFAGYTFDAGTNSSLSHSAHVGVSVSF